MKRIYLVCATGIATSTMLRVKLEEFLRDKGIKASIQQYRVTELSPDRVEADVIVSTTGMPAEFSRVVPVIDGVPLITGIGEEEILDELLRVLKTG